MTRLVAARELAGDRSLTGLDKSLLLLFICCSDDDNQISATLQELADELGYTRANVTHSMQKLVNKGLISRVKPGLYKISDRIVVSVNEARHLRLVRDA